MRLKNKVALITGGSTGIGKAITELFVREGAKVTIADINKIQGQRTASENKCIFVFCDISNEKSIEELYNFSKEHSSSIDILVNNAGIHMDNLLLKMKTDEWQKVLDVNLNGPFYLTRILLN